MSQSRYKFVYLHNDKSVEVDIKIPFEEVVEELAHVLILKNNLPIYIEKGVRCFNVSFFIYVKNYRFNRTVT